MSDLFKLNNIFFNVLQYSVSYIEFATSVAGIIAVWLATRSHILSWPIGLINISLSFIVFWQVQLYSDVFLQIYFFVIGVYGWYNWKYELKEKIPIKTLSQESKIKYSIIIITLSLIVGLFISYIHLLLPKIFNKPASFAYVDTFVAIASIVANTLLAKRILENWILWIIINLICIVLYFIKEIPFIAFQFFIFLIIAIIGHNKWKKEHTKSLSA